MRTAVAWVTILASLLIVWEGSLRMGLVSPAALAGPLEVLIAMPLIFLPSENGGDLASTLLYSLAAFLASVPIGLAAGYVVGISRSLARPLEFVLDFLRSIPATALVPVFLILVGISDRTKVTVGAFSSALVIAVSVTAGLATRSKTRLHIAEILRLDRTRRVLLVNMPEVLPHVFVGLRAGISLALILVVVTEMMIGGDRGLGRVIADMRYTDDKPRLYAAIMTTGVLGYGFNVILRLLERVILHWRGVAQ